MKGDPKAYLNPEKFNRNTNQYDGRGSSYKKPKVQVAPKKKVTATPEMEIDPEAQMFDGPPPEGTSPSPRARKSKYLPSNQQYSVPQKKQRVDTGRKPTARGTTTKKKYQSSNMNGRPQKSGGVGTGGVLAAGAIGAAAGVGGLYAYN